MRQVESIKPRVADIDVSQILKNAQERSEREKWPERFQYERPHPSMLQCVPQPMSAVAYNANSLGLEGIK